MAQQRIISARRLRTIRDLTKLTQGELGRRTGYSEIYVQKIEGLLSDLTEPFAESVAQVTGISWNWLLGRIGKDSAPVDGLRRPYDPQTFANRSRLHAQIDLDGSIADEIHDLCHYLAAALVEAYRKGHYGFVFESVRTLLKSIGKTLKLAFGSRKISSIKMEQWTFSGEAYADDPGLRKSLWTLLSPIAVMKWSDAREGTATDRREFLSELNSLYEMVATSFSDESDR